MISEFLLSFNLLYSLRHQEQLTRPGVLHVSSILLDLFSLPGNLYWASPHPPASLSILNVQFAATLSIQSTPLILLPPWQATRCGHGSFSPFWRLPRVLLLLSLRGCGGLRQRWSGCSQQQACREVQAVLRRGSFGEEAVSRAYCVSTS